MLLLNYNDHSDNLVAEFLSLDSKEILKNFFFTALKDIATLTAKTRYFFVIVIWEPPSFLVIKGLYGGGDDGL